uniref:Nucleoredoxin n=1 Tax=Zonotrichia albicollis TaxID=44394 RepID=A0A8D2N669_ZONAL
MGRHWTAVPWRALTSGSISLHTGARRAEASRGCWWSPTGKSRRQARNLRSSSSVQTGQRTPSSSTSARCPGWPCPTRTRPDGRA